jgi:hypothetical protein
MTVIAARMAISALILIWAVTPAIVTLLVLSMELAMSTLVSVSAALV